MNRLLQALSDEDRDLLRPHLQPVDFRQGLILYEAFAPLSRGYFVDEGVVSVVSVFEDGRTAEMGTIGTEGFVGLGAILHDEVAVGRHIVQVSGGAQRIEMTDLLRLLDRSVLLHDLLLRYARAFLCQVAQSVACNSIHSAEQRLARWLLMLRRRAESREFRVTQEFLAEMLGVRRPTVTGVAGSLQAAGLIRYSRGRITIVDQPGLEAVSCECDSLVRQHYDRLLPLVFPDSRADAKRS